MEYSVYLLDEAIEDIDSIVAYLSQFYPGTPQKFLAMLEDAKENLKIMPYMYPSYVEDAYYRKLVLSNYLVFYNINDEKKIVEIHRVIRGSWDIPRHFP